MDQETQSPVNPTPEIVEKEANSPKQVVTPVEKEATPISPKEEAPVKEKTKKHRQKLASDEESGEETGKPSKSRPGMYSDEDEEEDEIEETEEDRRFIVGDSEEEPAGEVEKEKESDSDDESGSESASLDEDDLDLVAEVTGKNRKRLKRHRTSRSSSPRSRSQSGEPQPQRDLDDMFEGEREEFDEEDDLDQFIDDDEGDRSMDDVDDEAARQARRRRKQQEMQRMRDSARSAGMDTAQYQELLEIFGDGNEYAHLVEKRRRLRDGYVDLMDVDEDGEPKKKRLVEAIEPSVLQERFLGDEDEAIRETDIPERFQLIENTTPFLGIQDPAAFHAEVVHIARRLNLEREEEIHAIDTILRFMREEDKHFLEVPFIYHQRMDYLPSHLDNSAVLWKVFKYSLEYQTQQKQLSELKKLVEKLRLMSQEATDDDLLRLYFGSNGNDGDFWPEMDATEVVQDMRRYIQMVYSSEIAELEEGKRRMRPSNYSLMKQAGIGDAAKLFGIDPRLFHNSIMYHSKVLNPEDDILPPEMAMAPFVSGGRYSTPESVLRAAKAMVAEKIAMDVPIRKHFRNEFLARCVVTVNPTERGRDIITEGHDYYKFKYVREKPLYEFTNSTVFAKMVKAEDEGLVVLDIFLENWEEQVRVFEGYVTSQGLSENSISWNKVRKEILHQALITIVKDCTKHVREHLLQEAYHIIVETCALELRNRLNTAPMAIPIQRNRRRADSYSDDEDDEVDEKKVGPRVLAITWGMGDRDSPTVACALNGAGLVSGYAMYHRLQDKAFGPGREDPPKKAEELRQLVDMAVSHNIDVVVVAGQSLATLALYKDVEAAFKKAKNVDGSRIKPHLHVEFGMDDTARAWRTSSVAKQEFPEYPELMRYCVGIGRRVQDPLMTYASLYNWDRDLLKISFNFEQSLVPSERLWERFEQVFMDVVAGVGVDLNGAIVYPHLRHTLQFVPGLGPRKATGIITKLYKNTTLESGTTEGVDGRMDLTMHECIGLNVFYCAAPFLRITKRFIEKGHDDTVDPLDYTRIHPDDYREARQIVTDALQLDQLRPGDEDDDGPQGADMQSEIVRLMHDPTLQEHVKHLSLDDYANVLFRDSGKRKRRILDLIVQELCNPYGEHRAPYRPPDALQIFTMFTGDTEDTFNGNMVVDATVRKVLAARAIIEFQNGLESSVFPSDFKETEGSDQWVKERSAIRVKINQVVKELEDGFPRFTVEVTANPQAVQNTRNVDVRFDAERERKDIRRKLEEKRKQEAKQAREFLNHPMYRREWGVEDAENYLAQREVGAFILRPSSSPGNLVAVIKLDEGWYWHLQIVKIMQGAQVKWQIKETKETFDDLDHMINAHIIPMVSRVKEIKKSQKFLSGADLRVAEASVNNAMLNDPSRASYMFCKGPAPGVYYLVYKFSANGTVSHERIYLGPGQFIFRTQKPNNLDELVRYFKKNPKPAAAQQPQGYGNYASYGGANSYQAQPASYGQNYGGYQQYPYQR